MNIEINYNLFSKVFLHLITTNSDFKLEFQAFAPEIYADIESFSKNPNCSCRAKIEQFVMINKPKCHEFINKFLTEKNIQVDLSVIEAQYKTISYMGTVEKVKISEWKQFSDSLIAKKAVYRSFSVSKIDDEYVNVFFL
jgi:hypothetical protein